MGAFLARLFYGALLLGAGILILKHRKQVRSWSGTFMWAEKVFGRGGTYVVIMFFGLLFIFLGVAFPFGAVDFLFIK